MNQGFYPGWLRLWHALHGVTFVVLLASGLRIHYADVGATSASFAWGVRMHDVAGVIYTGLWLWFVVANAVSANVRHYRLARGAMASSARQLRWYLLGMLRGEPRPFRRSGEHKFNPLQAGTYLVVMYALVPAVTVSGCFLYFPQLAPETVAGAGGVWPMALVHLGAAWALSLFLIVHLYMITTGPTLGAYAREMFAGQAPASVGTDLADQNSTSEGT